MRIGICGTHLSGKSTLVDDLAEALPQYLTVASPRQLLQGEGYVFSPVESLEDFENQLTRSFEALDDEGTNFIFDGTPIDLLAYLLTSPDVRHFDLPGWLPELKAAVETLDLIVYLPVEAEDRIRVPAAEDPEPRLDVDEKLRDLLVHNPLDLEVEVLEVTGLRSERVARVLKKMAGVARGAKP